MRAPPFILCAAGLSLAASACDDSRREPSHRIVIGGEIALVGESHPGMRGVSARFREIPFVVDDGEVDVGKCRSVDPERTQEDDDALLDAGETLELAGGSQGPLTLYRGAGDYYPEPATGYQWFEAFEWNDGYSVSGSGGAAVGAFSTALLAPAHVTLIAPALEILHSHEPLTVAWTSTDSGSPVFVTIQQTVAGDESYRALCAFADDGVGKVPAHILGHLRRDHADDDVMTMVHVAKRTLVEMEPAGVSAVVQVRGNYQDYALNYVSE